MEVLMATLKKCEHVMKEEVVTQLFWAENISTLSKESMETSILFSLKIKERNSEYCEKHFFFQ